MCRMSRMRSVRNTSSLVTAALLGGFGDVGDGALKEQVGDQVAVVGFERGCGTLRRYAEGEGHA